MRVQAPPRGPRAGQGSDQVPGVQLLQVSLMSRMLIREGSENITEDDFVFSGLSAISVASAVRGSGMSI